MSYSLELISAAGHEQVSVFQDKATGLLALIAVHSTTLGPGLGGCRMVHYDSIEEAMQDVLRLSEGMTYKNSLAGLDLGGGKSVIIGDRNREVGREELFLKFAECVATFQGDYYTAEDMGTRVSDIDAVASKTPYVAGRGQEHGGGGDPSPHTAEGVYQGIRAALGFVYGSESFEGRSVCIQGIGNVGYALAQKLAASGAKLFVSDTRDEQISRLCKEIDAKVVSLEEIYSTDCDVFAPCAMGAILNRQTIPQLSCKIVAGAANNQLECAEDEDSLTQRSIVYVPDFAINSGGVILCASELKEGGYDSAWVEEKVSQIYFTIQKVLEGARDNRLSNAQMALQMAKSRLSR